MKARRLKGHRAALTCCIASNSNPGIIASSSEDGCICYFDLRCKNDAIFVINNNVSNKEQEPISSICFKAGNEDVIYAASGNQISCFDVHKASSSTWKPLETYSYNKEEINQIAFSPNSYFLAAADDSGDVKLCGLDVNLLILNHSTQICSSVQFLSWKPWSAITGGLDCKLAMWDFSKGRAHKVVDYAMPQVNSAGSSNSIDQCFNPAFVHSIAVPQIDTQSKLKKVCAVAKGDGVIDVLELEPEPSIKSRNSSHHKKSQLASEDSKKLQLDYTLGGHTAAVSCVSFSVFGENGKFLISGGNDASVKLWDWSKHFDNAEASNNNERVLDINVKRKINWLCTTSTDSDNLIVCDTSKVLKAYTVP